MLSIFFFHCPKTVNERIILFRETHDHPLYLNVVLFGDLNIPLDGNITKPFIIILREQKDFPIRNVRISQLHVTVKP